MVIVPAVRPNRYTVRCFPSLSVEDLTELADEPTGSGKVARGGCLFGNSV